MDAGLAELRDALKAEKLVAYIQGDANIQGARIIGGTGEFVDEMAQSSFHQFVDTFFIEQGDAGWICFVELGQFLVNIGTYSTYDEVVQGIIGFFAVEADQPDKKEFRRLLYDLGRRGVRFTFGAGADDEHSG